MIDKDIINVISAIIIPLLVAIISSPIISNFFARKSKIQIKDVDVMSKYASKDFREKIIAQIAEESTFEHLTGISTNQQSISSYYELKNKLGNNFTWKQIKNAKPYLRFDNDNNIFVNLPKALILLKNISLGIAFIILFASIIMLLYVSNLEIKLSDKLIISFIVYYIYFMLCIYFILHSLVPVIDAHMIKKRMNNLDK
ncbi:hypothetical protein OKE68_06570 [Riemerella anatipestifer]|uniref:Uncharacterized protein n=1 Tax=Riemerella anatipestifer TaxID=34085 RepID=A0AAP3EZE4_RIEAN|nr:hypothetical protein [Riemerella anatipestifer]AZZ58472.1 hypothetical protein AWB57_05145 [Riemerella anatipestifer]MBT0573087.1 hypothetical protein [Riemerella anatipestifer]MCU7568457.1 hypothetical protein [Riemerella anatipestifer]MCW0490408.1 hypothetical protein [Riemerella anatipestifer]MCW0511223.1 hypothetical protein [Riemerella anatipestifer]